MQKVLKERGGLLVYFNTLPERWFLPSESEVRSQLPLTEIVTAADGSIYQLNPLAKTGRTIEPTR